MADPAIGYAPRPDTTPERELAALANVYRFILDAGKIKAGGTNAGDEEKGTEDDLPVSTSLPHS